MILNPSDLKMEMQAFFRTCNRIKTSNFPDKLQKKKAKKIEANGMEFSEIQFRMP